MQPFRSLILFVCLLAALSLPCQAQMLCGIAGTKGGCSSATDEIGDRTSDYADNYDMASGGIMCALYTAECTSGCASGTLEYGYTYHNGTGSDEGKICVYSDDGDSTPDQDGNDLLIACSGEFSSSTNGALVETPAKLTGAVTCGTNYYVCIVGGDGSWKYEYDATGTRTVWLASGFNYASPPANLGSVDFASTASRDMAVYVEIE